jgi:hypothetical protein
MLESMDARLKKDAHSTGTEEAVEGSGAAGETGLDAGRGAVDADEVARPNIRDKKFMREAFLSKPEKPVRSAASK